MIEHKAWPKTPRITNETFLITEKIDGTNSVIFISDDLETVKAGSRNRWLDISDDNYGFCSWVNDNKDELRKLGSGYHYGEWWGHKIQRGYGLKHRVFSLFQTRCEELPQCVNTVPCLGQTNFSDLKNTIQNLWLEKMSWCAKEQGVDYESCEGFIVLSALTGIRYKVVF